MSSTSPEPSYLPKLYRKLRDAIRIDQMRVSDELMESADLVMTCAEHCAMAMALRDEKAADVKVVSAQRAAVYRKRLVNGKARSETEIKSLVEGDEQVAATTQIYEEARLSAALWSALVNAAQLKHSALKRVAEMIVSGYLTTPSIVGNRRKELNEARTKRREREHDDRDDSRTGEDD